jgi:hypothetical protein
MTLLIRGITHHFLRYALVRIASGGSLHHPRREKRCVVVESQAAGPGLVRLVRFDGSEMLASVCDCCQRPGHGRDRRFERPALRP